MKRNGKSLGVQHGNNFHYNGGFVYVIRHPVRGMFKIGESRDPWCRLDTLKKQMNYDGLEMIHTILTNNARTLERYFHKRFARVCIGGEWFELTDDMLSEIQTASAVMYPTLGVIQRADWVPLSRREMKFFRKQPYPVCGWVSPSGA